MSYGLRIVNPTGELVVDSEARGLIAVHKATFVSLVQENGASVDGATPGRLAGYSTYTSNHSGPILLAVDLPAGKNVGLIDVGGSAGAWTITAYCADTPDPASGLSEWDLTQYALDIWVFGFPASVASTWGLALFNSSGSLTYDFSRNGVMWPRSLVDQAFGASPVAIPSLTRPVAVAVPSSWTATDATITINSRYRTERRGFWKRTGSTLTQVLRRTAQYKYFGPDPIGDEGDVFGATSFIVEGALLP